jgi:hypothetical protein
MSEINMYMKLHHDACIKAEVVHQLPIGNMRMQQRRKNSRRV